MEEREQSLEATIASGDRELSLSQQAMELHKKKVSKDHLLNEPKRLCICLLIAINIVHKVTISLFLFFHHHPHQFFNYRIAGFSHGQL